MSGKQQRSNRSGRVNPRKQNKLKKENKSNQSNKLSRNRKRRNNLSRRINSQSVRFRRTEVWQQDNFAQSNDMQVKNYVWNLAGAAPWFKAMATMYEKVKYNNMQFRIIFGGSAMTKGTYVLSYNTNEVDALNPNNDFKQLSAQKGARVIRASRGNAFIRVDRTGLTGYSTTLPNTAEGSYLCNVIIGGIPVESVDFSLIVTYDVTFYNPQHSN